MSDLLSGISLTLTLADRRKQKHPASAPCAAKAKAAAPHSKPLEPVKVPAPAPRFNPDTWIPLDRLTYIGIQRCSCCALETRYIAGDLIRYFQPENVGGQRTIRTRAFSAADQRFVHLARTIEELPAEEHTCPSCLYGANAIQAVLEHTHAVQIPLFL